MSIYLRISIDRLNNKRMTCLSLSTIHLENGQVPVHFGNTALGLILFSKLLTSPNYAFSYGLRLFYWPTRFHFHHCFISIDRMDDIFQYVASFGFITSEDGYDLVKHISIFTSHQSGIASSEGVCSY